jgi:hypothetical protein
VPEAGDRWSSGPGRSSANRRARVRVGAYAALLAGYAGALVHLANTAHQGGRLVSEQGVHALTAPSGPAPAGPAMSEKPVAERLDDED